MDPNITLLEICASLADGDTNDARERFEDLADWIGKGGGFRPNLAKLYRLLAKQVD